MCAQYVDHVDSFYSNKVCANDGAILHHLPTKQQYVALPLELSDHNLGSDMVYLKKIQLIS